MAQWNVVVSTAEGGFAQAIKYLERFGRVSRTDFFNVVLLQVDTIHDFLEAFQKQSEEDRHHLLISRAIPVTATFTFHRAEEFEARAKEVVLRWAPLLAGKSFHVRMHRRGFKGKLSSADEERLLSEALMEATEKTGLPGRITFENPDAIVAVETIGPEAGLSLWTREELEMYPFVRLD